MNLLNELKRRNVFKVAIAYAIVSWIVLQIGAIAFPALGLPDWTMTMLIVFTLIGFPFVMLFAWAFELTPDGIKATSEVDASISIQQNTGQKINTIVISALVLAVLFMVVDNYVLDEPSSSVIAAAELIESSAAQTPTPQLANTVLATFIDEQSIAVLPFVNLSADADQEYFSDGLSEELINKLSQVPDLLVTGRNSSFYFKGRNEELREIGEILEVAHILQGSVRKAGDQLRITAQLVDAQTNTNLWSRSFDRDLADIFAIQDEIAIEVTTALSITLGIGEFDRAGMTRNVAAYDAYLKGQAVLQEVGMEPLQALGHYQTAVMVDAEFGLGWLALAVIYQTAIINEPGEVSRDFPQLRVEALENARRIAPDMLGLLLAEATETYRRSNDWLEAEELHQRLFDTYGNSIDGINRSYGIMLAMAGKRTLALPYLQRARRLDPLNVNTSMFLGSTLLSLGRLEEAVAEANRGLDLNNRAAGFQFFTANKVMAKYIEDDLSGALELLRLYPLGTQENEYVLPVVELLVAGDIDQAKALFIDFTERDLSPIAKAALRPMAYFVEDVSLGLDIFEFFGIVDWQEFESELRSTEEFKRLADEAGLVDYWRATGWNDFCQPIPNTENDFECH